jgi:flavin-dependent dehydrogenase
VMSESAGLGAENTREGVRVTVQTPSGVRTLDGRYAIAADGKRSKIVESIGINKKRKRFAPGGRKFVHYIMEGVESDVPAGSFASFTIPSINPHGNILYSMGADNTCVVGTMAVGVASPVTVLERFMTDSRYESWFRNARIVKKEGAVGRRAGALTPVKEPYCGNVIVAGDAGAPSETWVQGAMACGYQSIQAIKKELNGEEGCREYTRWWQNSFAFNTPEYLELNKGIYPVNRLCTDDEVDYIYRRFQERIGIPQLMLAKNIDVIKQEKPELYHKFAKLHK